MQGTVPTNRDEHHQRNGGGAPGSIHSRQMPHACAAPTRHGIQSKMLGARFSVGIHPMNAPTVRKDAGRSPILHAASFLAKPAVHGSRKRCSRSSAGDAHTKLCAPALAPYTMADALGARLPRSSTLRATSPVRDPMAPNPIHMPHKRPLHDAIRYTTPCSDNTCAVHSCTHHHGHALPSAPDVPSLAPFLQYTRSPHHPRTHLRRRYF